MKRQDVKEILERIPSSLLTGTRSKFAAAVSASSSVRRPSPCRMPTKSATDGPGTLANRPVVGCETGGDGIRSSCSSDFDTFLSRLRFCNDALLPWRCLTLPGLAISVLCVFFWPDLNRVTRGIVGGVSPGCVT